MPASDDHGRISVQACVETLSSVILCWGAALHFDSCWHLIGSVVLAPLFLLRSPPAMAAARQWFVRDWFGFEEHVTWHGPKRAAWTIGIAVTAALPLCLLAWAAWGTGTDGFKWQYILTVLFIFSVPLLAVTVIMATAITIFLVGGGPGGAAFVRPMARMNVLVATGALMVLVASQFEFAGRMTSFLVGAALGGVAGAVVWAGVHVMLDKASGWHCDVATLSGMGIGMSVALSMGAAAGLACRAVLARVLATLRHLPAGLARLPWNMSEAWLTMHVLQPAELVPGLSAFHAGAAFEPALRGWQGEMWRWRAWVAVTSALRVPALLLRLSLKGTAWFWWPLGLWLRPSPARIDAGSGCVLGPQLSSAGRHEWLWTRCSLLLALASAVLYCLRDLPWAKAPFLSANLLPLKVSLAVGWDDIRPWHWALWIIAATGLGLRCFRGAEGPAAGLLLRSMRKLAAAGLILLTAGAAAVAFPGTWEQSIAVPPLMFREAECWYRGEDAVVKKYGPSWRKLFGR